MQLLLVSSLLPNIAALGWEDEDIRDAFIRTFKERDYALEHATT